MTRLPYASLSYILAVTCIMTTNVYSENTKASIGDANEHNLVMRVTREHFDNLMHDEFEETIPVDRAVLSTWVTGSSQVKGQVDVELESDVDEAIFIVTLDGQAHSTTVSSERSVRVHSTGITTFHAEKRIHFDGLAYHGKPTVVTLEQETEIGDIVSTRDGFIGRLSVKIARRRIPQIQPEVSRIIKQDTKQAIQEEFDTMANELIEKLNKTTPLEETILLLYPKSKDWVYSLSTTGDHIQASVGPKGLRFPELPIRADGHRDPVEIWVRTGQVKVKTRVINVWNNAQDVLKLAYLAGVKLPEIVRGDIKLEEVEDWVVIPLGNTSELLKKRR
ncbi:MAG: hypothetical protein COA78_10360 [Blastopirellula sp.]|nr:MAG: hypothetical protein COA78_10360 [Blastopirellula sp.]